MKYNAYDELMSYFSFEFNIYIILTIIILVGLIKSVIKYARIKKINALEKVGANDKIYDLIISLLSIIGFTNAMFFQGVMSDIPMESGYVWFTKSFYLFITAVVLFNFQIIFIALTDLSIKKLRKEAR